MNLRLGIQNQYTCTCTNAILGADNKGDLDFYVFLTQLTYQEDWEFFFFQKIKCFKNQVIKINENINFSRYKNQIDSKFRTISDFISLLGKRLAGQKKIYVHFLSDLKIVKFRYYEKATKFEKKSSTCFDKTVVFTQ